MGDRRWRELLGGHDALAREQLQRYRGREVKMTGDGLLATFDGPARAVACAAAIGREVRALGLEVRGVHRTRPGLDGEMAVQLAWALRPAMKVRMPNWNWSSVEMRASSGAS
jgi:class 3 adenylate cyclase